MSYQHTLLVVFAILGVTRCAAAEAVNKADLDPALPYQAALSNKISYDIDFAAVVTAPYHTKRLKVWLPLPPSDNVQTVESRELSVFPHDIKPRIETEKVYGNRFAYFEFDHPEGAQIIRHNFRVTTHEMNWNVDPGKVSVPAAWPDSFAPYLAGDQAVVVNDAIRQAAERIVSKRQNASTDLALVMDWTQAQMKYDHGRASLGASSLHAIETGAGHCSDYHGLCSALGRALGYPTRVTYGLNLFPKNSPSHCKLEAYLPAYGWVSFDVSETQRLVAAIEKDEKLSDEKRNELRTAALARLRSGFRDNTWLLQTRGTGYDLAPPAAKKVNVVRTIYAEADGVALADPDPADPAQRAFAWHIGMKITPERAAPYPFSHR